MTPTPAPTRGARFVRWTTGPLADPIEDIGLVVAPVGRDLIDGIRVRIEVWAQLVAQRNRDGWHAERAEAAEALALVETRHGEAVERLAKIVAALDRCEPVRPLEIACLFLAVGVCFGAEYAWSVSAFPFLLDLERTSILGMLLSALPVAAVTAMGCA
ncbi:MAG: hypothetical protein HOP16_21325, partial [Acidobacteria bacterium]|nr:hypothetical protein [Acidobacteriota bacterium]